MGKDVSHQFFVLIWSLVSLSEDLWNCALYRWWGWAHTRWKNRSKWSWEEHCFYSEMKERDRGKGWWMNGAEKQRKETPRRNNRRQNPLGSMLTLNHPDIPLRLKDEWRKKLLDLERGLSNEEYSLLPARGPGIRGAWSQHHVRGLTTVCDSSFSGPRPILASTGTSMHRWYKTTQACSLKYP